MIPLADAGVFERLWEKATTDRLQILALAAQAVFGARVYVQWIASERAKRIVVPVLFWWLSIAGSAGLFVFFALKGEPVILLAQVLQIFIYVRNLVIHRRSEASAGGA